MVNARRLLTFVFLFIPGPQPMKRWCPHSGLAISLHSVKSTNSLIGIPIAYVIQTRKSLAGMSGVPSPEWFYIPPSWWWLLAIIASSFVILACENITLHHTIHHSLAPESSWSSISQYKILSGKHQVSILFSSSNNVWVLFWDSLQFINCDILD